MYKLVNAWILGDTGYHITLYTVFLCGFDTHDAITYMVLHKPGRHKISTSYKTGNVAC